MAGLDRTWQGMAGLDRTWQGMAGHDMASQGMLGVAHMAGSYHSYESSFIRNIFVRNIDLSCPKP